MGSPVAGGVYLKSPSTDPSLPSRPPVCPLFHLYRTWPGVQNGPLEFLSADEDEVYFVISGRARLKVEDEERVVGPGTVLYVRGTSEHSFVEIEEDTTLLVFFASGGPSPD